MNRSYNIERNKFLFKCNNCSKRANIHITNYKRNGYVKCPKCGQKQYVKLNWRAEVAQRTEVKNSTAYIITDVRSYKVELANYSTGGIGLRISEQLVSKVQLKPGDCITVLFSFNSGDYRGDFVVKSLQNAYVGLQYKDKRMLSPMQRIIEYNNRSI